MKGRLVLWKVINKWLYSFLGKLFRKGISFYTQEDKYTVILITPHSGIQPSTYIFTTAATQLAFSGYHFILLPQFWNDHLSNTIILTCNMLSCDMPPAMGQWFLQSLTCAASPGKVVLPEPGRDCTKPFCFLSRRQGTPWSQIVLLS